MTGGRRVVRRSSADNDAVQPVRRNRVVLDVEARVVDTDDAEAVVVVDLVADDGDGRARLGFNAIAIDAGCERVTVLRELAVDQCG